MAEGRDTDRHQRLARWMKANAPLELKQDIVPDFRKNVQTGRWLTRSIWREEGGARRVRRLMVSDLTSVGAIYTL